MSGKYALVFGNTQYADPALAQLTAPGKDAEDLGRVLKAADLCSFDEVSVLLNERSTSAIEAIDAFFDSRKPDDLLVLYFSGHGIRDELGSLYLAFSNTMRSRLRSTALKAEYIREAMDESRSKRQVLILDCCNSGAFPSGTKAELGGVMGMANALQGYGRYVLTASDATQFAWEGDRVIGETSNSLFTHFLVKGLEGEADRDGDGSISVDDLYDYAFAEIARATPKQTPTKSASKQEGDIVLRRITRLEDIKPASLPDDLVDAIGDSRTFVREGAVQQLAKLLGGKNLGLARSAREALEQLCEQDDSLRVRAAAKEVLAPVLAAEQQQAEAERPAPPKAQEPLQQAAKAEAAPAAQSNAERDAAKPARSGKIQEIVHELEAADEKFVQQKRGGLEKFLKRPVVYGEQSLGNVGRTDAAKPAVEASATAAMQPAIRTPLLPALFIGLGYATSAILWPLFGPEVRAGYTVFGGLAGLIIAIILYSQRLLKQWTSVLLVTAVWGLVGWIYGSIMVATNYSANPLSLGIPAGLFEGSILGFALYRDKALSRPLSILGFPVLWISTEVAAEGLIQSIGSASMDMSTYSLVNSVVLFVLGVATGFAMLKLVPFLNPETKTQQPSALPRWSSALWAATGCALAGCALAVAAEWSSDPGRRQAVIVLGSYGLCIGFFITVLLLAERSVHRGRSLLAIPLGWAGVWAVMAVVAASEWYIIGTTGVWVLFVLTWAFGGLITGAVLRDEHMLPSWGSVGLVTLACAVGGGIAALIMGILANLGVPSSNALPLFAGAGALAGAILGAGMLGVLRRNWRKASQG